jgi:hypothetical protein
MVNKIITLCCSFIFIGITPMYSVQYHIGPGQTFIDIQAFSNAIGFNQLRPFDEIYIHYRIQPYRSFIFINTNHLMIIGVPSANGELPIIDGSQALQTPYLWQDSNNFYTDTDGINDPNPTNPNIYTYYSGGLYHLGLITIGRKSGSQYTDVPTNIRIENLEIRNAHQDQTFTPWFSGLVDVNHPYASIYNATYKNYAPFVSGIRVQRGENITIKNCHIHQCGNGIFVNSVVDDNNGNGNFDAGDVSLISRNILIEHCSIHDNGCYNGNSCHNIYCEASGSIYQYNYLGGKKAGSLESNCLKDRSSGTVIRYNFIEGIDQGHLLDLVEAEASAPLMKDEPDYHNTYVYGNVLINPPSGPVTPIHYGGDHCDYEIYRRGNLHFFNNTFVNIADQSQKYRTSLFFFPVSNYFSGPPWCTVSPASFDESLIARNNIIYNAPLTSGATPSELYLLQTDLLSTHSFQNNFISTGFQNGFSGVWDFSANQYKPFIANVAHTQTFSPALNNPGFLDIDAYDFHLNANAFCRDLGTSSINPHLVSHEYINHQNFIIRYNDGFIDLGALEYQNPLFIPEYTFEASLFKTSILLDWSNIFSFLKYDDIDLYKFNDKNEEFKLNIDKFSDEGRYEDHNPTQGWNFYKICGLDQNIVKKCTEIKAVYYNGPNSFYPNPAIDKVFISQYEGFTGLYTILDPMGKIICTKKHDGSGIITLDNIASGIIIIKSALGNTQISKL